MWLDTYKLSLRCFVKHLLVCWNIGKRDQPAIFNSAKTFEHILSTVVMFTVTTPNTDVKVY